MRLSALLLLLVACGDKDPQPVAEADADTDADTDTDTDADTDADTDSDTDVDTADWSHCPDDSSYLGDSSWPTSIDADDGAVYCSAWNEERTLEEEQGVLSKLRLVEGSWALPADEGEHDLSLPLCVAKPSIDAQPSILGTGSTTVTASTWSGTTYTYLQGSQDLEEADGSSWSMVHLMVLVADEGDPPGAIAADGGPPDAETGSGAEFTLVPSGSSDSDPEAITYIPCKVEDWDVFTHTVTFDGGEVTLQLNLGDNVVQTAPGSFSIAEGTLDGTAFSQTDRFKLVYRPGHHHFERDFAVIFDDPIGDACALRIEAIDGVDDGITAEVHTADCELGILEAREVTAETLTEE